MHLLNCPWEKPHRFCFLSKQNILICEFIVEWHLNRNPCQHHLLTDELHRWQNISCCISLSYVYFKINANKFNLLTGHSLFSMLFSLPAKFIVLLNPKLQLPFFCEYFIFKIVFYSFTEEKFYTGLLLFLLPFYISTLPFLGTQNLFV